MSFDLAFAGLVLHDFKALLSVFKGRVSDPSRERETAVERCEVSVQDGEGQARSRFVVRIICRHGMSVKPLSRGMMNLTLIGVIKTYRLTFESVAPMHAQFTKANVNNHWAISSRTLREFVEHFGPGTEQLDIYSENGRVSLTSYTEKIVSGNGCKSSGFVSRLLLTPDRNTEATSAYNHSSGHIGVFGVFSRRTTSHRHQRQGLQIHYNARWHNDYSCKSLLFPSSITYAVDVQ